MTDIRPDLYDIRVSLLVHQVGDEEIENGVMVFKLRNNHGDNRNEMFDSKVPKGWKDIKEDF